MPERPVEVLEGVSGRGQNQGEHINLPLQVNKKVNNLPAKYRKSAMTLDDGFSDLLGDPPDDRFELPPVENFSARTADAHLVSRGVGVTWLSEAFGLSRTVTQSRLATCPALRTAQNGGKVYDIRVAAAYLVKPRVSIEEYLNGLEPKDLPQQLQKEFWAAKLSEQRWRKQAGELFAAEDVIAVFGEVFKLIKNKTRLWQNSISSVEALSIAQIEVLQNLTEDLLDKIYQSLLALESGSKTPSQLAEVDDDDDAAEDEA